MRKNIIISAALGAAVVTGLAGCGTTTVVVQTEAITETTTTVAQSAKAQTTANEGSLSKKNTQTTEAVAEATTYAASNKDEYYFYDSDSRLLTEADLEGMSVEEMRLARNEIFARHGRKFKDKELSDYYSSKSWYNPTIDSDDFNANVKKYLNETEIRNAEFIKSVEDKIKAETERSQETTSASAVNDIEIKNVDFLKKTEDKENSENVAYSDKELKRMALSHFKSEHGSKTDAAQIDVELTAYEYNGDGQDIIYKEIYSVLKKQGGDIVQIDFYRDESDKNTALDYSYLQWIYYINRSTGKGKQYNWMDELVSDVDLTGY